MGKTSLHQKVFRRLGFDMVIPVNLALSDGSAAGTAIVAGIALTGGGEAAFQNSSKCSHTTCMLRFFPALRLARNANLFFKIASK